MSYLSRNAIDHGKFTHHGREMEYMIVPDEDTGPPWENDDGTGDVSAWTRRAKRPGERILCAERGAYRYYDMQAATEQAWRDGWGSSPKALVELSTKLGREPTKGDIIHAAVERDFQFLRGWCNDQWCYVGVVVTDVESREQESLWGVEYGYSQGMDAYWLTVRDELAEGLHPEAELEEMCVLGEN